ncbi:MAG: hypothetical protein ACXWLZ_00035 [Rhizomicrobium sp.]
MDPITLALLGGGGTLLSSFLNSSAQNSVNNARNGVIQAERGRQAGLDTEAKGVTDQSLGRYNNFDTQQGADAARLSDFFKTQVTTPNTPYTVAPLPPVSSDQVAREVNAKNDIAKAYVNHQADTLGKLRSFGDLFGGINRGVAQDTQQVGQLGNFKKGSTAVEQLELDNANRAGNTQKTWADIAGGLGKVALTAGLSGAFAPAAAAGVGADGSILGAVGPTSVGGAPLVGQAARFIPPPNIFATGASPFLSYGR